MAAFRWFSFARGDGPCNMAADEVLLHTAADQGITSLRFYGWSSATVSLGYFQPAAVRRQPLLAQLPWVRRPSGGNTLVHHLELTYALALPPGFSPAWMTRMHGEVILPALCRSTGTPGLEVVSREPSGGYFLCFEQQTRGDLIAAGRKVVGSAQRKYRQGLLQHGSILLRQSEHAPQLPGIKELLGVDISVEELQEAILSIFSRHTGWKAEKGQWSAEEDKAIIDLAANKYRSKEWNEKR